MNKALIFLSTLLNRIQCHNKYILLAISFVFLFAILSGIAMDMNYPFASTSFGVCMVITILSLLFVV
jgi:hypothetical protein